MKKNRQDLLGLILLLLAVLPGCAPVISKSLRARADPLLSFREVSENPNAYKGKIVIWGGEIARTINQKDQTTTLIEVLQRPLKGMEEPDITKPSSGRFIVFSREYLDAFIFQEGIRITVAGEILGEEVRPLGTMQYRYPLILNKEIYLWRYHYYYPSRRHPQGHFYFPWWWYDPW